MSIYMFTYTSGRISFILLLDELTILWDNGEIEKCEFPQRTTLNQHWKQIA